MSLLLGAVMQNYDVLLSLSTALLLMSLWRSQSVLAGYRVWVLLFTVLMALLHGMYEGLRWQLVPVYLVVAISVVCVIRSYGKVDAYSSAKRRWFLFGGAYSLLLLSLLFSYLFPVFSLPEPTGQYAVGITDIHLVDKHRQELNSEQEGDFRELMVTAWYPVDVDVQGESSTYWPASDAGVMSQYLLQGVTGKTFSFLFSHLANVKTHALINAPIATNNSDLAGPPLADGLSMAGALANNSFPVLIYSHGYGSFSRQNTVLMEELASHGYIVFAINNTYWSMATVFPDGKVIGLKAQPAALLAEGAENSDSEAEFESLLENTTDTEALAAIVEKIRKMAPLTAQNERDRMAVWIKDRQFLMDTLEQWQLESSGSLFSGRMDLNKLGVFGMSIGGQTTIETCTADKRCKAGVNLDGFSIVSSEAPALTIPFMHLAGERTTNLFRLPHASAQGPSYIVSIAGSEHIDYSDISLITPLAQDLGVRGSIDGDRMLEIMNVYVLAFFDKYLKVGGNINMETGDQLERLSAGYPEITVLSKNTDPFHQ